MLELWRLPPALQLCGHWSICEKWVTVSGHALHARAGSSVSSAAEASRDQMTPVN